jgi:DNA-binding NarL/FixJ family response regulator
MFFRPDLSFSRVSGAILEEKEMKIFIADDSKVIVERLADLLRDIPGVELTGQAGDAPEAMRCIEEKKPDALILDLQMPGGSGLEVLRAIRPDHPALQILVCTNYAYPQYREECLSAGANYFLDKSAEFEKIPAILGELIKNFAKSAPAARQT